MPDGADVRVQPPRAAPDEHAVDVLTPAVRDLIARLHDGHAPALADLLAAREQAAPPTGLRPGTAEQRAAVWRVAEPPPWLRDRRCEITGPAEPALMVNALTSGARVFMADLEDSLSPTWTNVVTGYRALRDAAAGSLSRTRPDGTVTTPGDDAAVLVVRPRGLHLPEPRVLVGDATAAAPLVDVAVVASWTAHAWAERGRGLALYLPKLEHADEAAWWHRVLLDVERSLGLEPASIPVTVLVETFPLVFQMDEVLHALRARPCALNAGRWDYLFSVIKTLGDDPAHVLPDRSALTMRTGFMAAYATRLVTTAHRRGAWAIGGMAAFVPNRRRPEVTERAVAAVRADKDREAALGYDGTWVAHPDLVPVATAAFDAVLADRLDQLDITGQLSDDASELLDTAVPGALSTRTGLRDDITVALLYLVSWLGGRGAVSVHDLMEDVATAEIARAQLWQWVHHGVELDDGSTVTADLVSAEVRAAVDTLRAGGIGAAALAAAAEVLAAGALAPDLPPFLTLLALPRLDG